MIMNYALLGGVKCRLGQCCAHLLSCVPHSVRHIEQVVRYGHCHLSLYRQYTFEYTCKKKATFYSLSDIPNISLTCLVFLIYLKFAAKMWRVRQKMPCLTERGSAEHNGLLILYALKRQLTVGKKINK